MMIGAVVVFVVAVGLPVWLLVEELVNRFAGPSAVASALDRGRGGRPQVAPTLPIAA
jgi:hypothetical protein